MSDSDLLAGSMYSFGEEECLDRLRDLVTKLLLEGKEVPKEIRDFCGYDNEDNKLMRGEI